MEAIVEPLSLYEPVYSENGDSLYVIDQLSDSSRDASDESRLENLALREAVATLNPREQTIIRLRFYQDKTQMEIASGDRHIAGAGIPTGESGAGKAPAAVMSLPCRAGRFSAGACPADCGAKAALNFNTNDGRKKGTPTWISISDSSRRMRDRTSICPGNASWGYRYGPSIMVHGDICEAWFASRATATKRIGLPIGTPRTEAGRGARNAWS